MSLPITLPEPIKYVYDAKDLAEILGCTRSRIHACIREGRLSPVDKDKHTPQFTPDEVRRFLAEYKRPGRPWPKNDDKVSKESADNV